VYLILIISDKIHYHINNGWPHDRMKQGEGGKGMQSEQGKEVGHIKESGSSCSFEMYKISRAYALRRVYAGREGWYNISCS